MLLLAGLAALLAVAALTGLLDVALDRHRLQIRIEEAGMAGPLVFLALMTFLVALGVPGIAFILSASTIWPAPAAVGLVLAGGMSSSSLRFLFARSIGRKWVESRLPARMRRWDARLAEGGFWIVVTLRLLFNLAAPPDWLLGLSRVSTRRFLLGTLVGRIPPTIILVIAGAETLRWLWQQPVAAAGVAAVVVIAALARRQSREPNAASAE